MKKFVYILFASLFLFTACKEPNPTEPDTKRDISEVLDYQIIYQTESGFQSEVLTEMVIRDNQELKRIISSYSTSTNLDLVDKLLKIELGDDALVIISSNIYSENASISLDSIYLDNSGVIQIDYKVYRKLGINSRVNAPTLAILLKNRNEAIIKFNKRFENDGEVPELDGFKTIGEDIIVDSKRKWKEVFTSADEFKQWASDYNAKDVDFINDVDFDKELVISVGNNRFQSGLFNYRITNIQQQGGRIIVNSVFTMVKVEYTLSKQSNHFVKIKRTGLPIYFNPLVIVNNVFTGGKFYHENYRQISIEAPEKSTFSITKVSNYAELFSEFNPIDDLEPANVEIDFEFFDLLIVKAPTTNYKALKFEIEYIKRDDFGIKGFLFVHPDNTDFTKNYDNYLFIKILKTNIPISKNFEVIVK